MIRRLVLLIACVAACQRGSAGEPCEEKEVSAPESGFFVDISGASGIRDENFVADPDQPIPINDHSRLGFADIDGDGFDDVVMHSLYPNPEQGVPFEHLVFRNRGDGTFENVSDASGLRDVQAGFFAFGDVDNDGDQDAFAGLDIPLSGERHTLLLNDGSGRFEPRADSGLEGTAGQTAAGNAVFADFDGDANLDLYLGRGHTRYRARDALYLGRGDGTFEEASERLADAPISPTNGTVACDYDEDGDLDVFASVYGVSERGAQNILWENDGSGSFVDVAVERGFASLPGGNYHLGLQAESEPGGEPGGYVGSNGFGLDCADVTGDGHLDVLVTAISHPDDFDESRRWSDPTVLLVNQGPAAGYSFENEFLERGLPFNEGDIDGALVDFDNDGRLDVSVSRESKYEGRYEDPAQKSWFGLFRQLPDGSFAGLGLESGINDPDEELGRMKGAQNHAWSDIDRDGDLDLLVGGRDQGGGRPNFLFENRVESGGRWLAVRLRGDGEEVNRDAIGARVELVSPERVFARELKASRGMHNSLDSRALHFGLGSAGCELALRIRWPDGTVHEFEADEVPLDTYVTADYATGELRPAEGR